MKINSNINVRGFTDLVGNDTIIKIVRNWVKNNKVPNSLLFTGKGGTGKSTLAEILGMTLLCENRNDKGPCFQCKECKSAQEILEKGGSTDRLLKVNMATVKDIGSLIEDLFILQSRHEKVYILEEMQSVDPDDQDALLEEYKKLKGDSYVFFCTTEPWKLKDTLRGRAVNIRMRKPDFLSCGFLINSITDTVIDSKTQNIIINKCERNPRSIIKTVRSLEAGESLDLETVSKYFNNIAIKDLIEYLRVLSDTFSDYTRYIATIDDVPNFIRSFKEFIVDTVIEINGVGTKFSKSESEDIQKGIAALFSTEVQLIKFLEGVGKIPARDSLYNLFRVKYLAMGIEEGEYVNRDKLHGNMQNRTNKGRKKEKVEVPDMTKRSLVGKSKKFLRGDKI